MPVCWIASGAFAAAAVKSMTLPLGAVLLNMKHPTYHAAMSYGSYAAIGALSGSIFGSMLLLGATCHTKIKPINRCLALLGGVAMFAGSTALGTLALKTSHDISRAFAAEYTGYGALSGGVVVVGSALLVAWACKRSCRAGAEANATDASNNYGTYAEV